MQQHVIQKQVLNVKFSTREQHLLLSEEVKTVFKNNIQHRISNLFDSISTPDQFIVINRLTLDIGNVSTKEMEDVLVEQVLQKMEDQLIQYIEEHPHGSENNPVLQTKDERQSVTESFIFFLLSGQFSWWYPPQSIEAFEFKILKEMSPEFIEIIKMTLEKAKARKRLSYQFSDSFFKQIIELVDREKYRENPDVQLTPTKKIKILEELISSYSSKKTILSKEKLKLRKVSKPEQFIKEQNSVILKNTTEGIYIQNAGILLLWVYLEPFFEELKLVKNAAFKTEDAQQRAVLLLQYLCTSQTKTTESELILNKVLCGMPIDDPIPAEISLTAKEQTESKALLHTMIKHWTALKNTSPEVLQETFLQRDGKLSRVDGGWLLQIEEKAVDILLSHLSWSVSLIKLLWTEEMVWVEWGETQRIN